MAAILPFCVHLVLPGPLTGDMSLRELRLLRLARLLKTARAYSGVRILGLALQRSGQALGMLCFFLAFGVVLSSSMMYFIEKNANPAGFGSIPTGFWWGIVTMTGTGYGDVGARRLWPVGPEECTGSRLSPSRCRLCPRVVRLSLLDPR